MSSTSKQSTLSPTDMPAVSFSARALAFVAPFMASSDIRYYLCGFHLLPHPAGGVLVCATDGHQLAVVYDPEGRTDRPVILRADWRTVRAAGMKRAASVSIVGGRLTVTSGFEGQTTYVSDPAFELSIQAGNPVVEGKFPDVLRILPQAGEDLLPGAFGTHRAAYVERAAAAFRKMGGNRAVWSVQQWTRNGDAGAVFMRSPAEPNAIVMTMPITALRPEERQTEANGVPAFLVGAR